jgi:hypothetical protein
MKRLPDTTFITNDTERSFVIQKENGHTDLSVLVPSGSDPAHLCISSYENGKDEPVSEVRLYSEEVKVARKLLNDPVSIQILGIDD